ncbi:MAG TPA: SDR family oxidoreductase [Aggregatilineaceae bacterium]|nr:SDR family oxidoreductase [Anaerolineae bacterium]HMM29625.1 SDR family oxidoreductase [Aggregatilineaceae bacterium]
MDLEHKVALVTGGAHRVGKAIALALADAGAHVVIHYGSSEAEAHETVRELKSRGVQALAVQADLGDPAAIKRLFEAVSERFNRLDILVNSAANFVKQPFDEVTLDDWKTVMQVNLRAPFFCTQQAARLMRAVHRPADQPAAIVNISDLAGVYPWRDFVQHGVAKAGLIHLTKISARELGPDVRVNAITPGAILPPSNLSPDSPRWKRMGESVPLLRTGHPDYVAQTAIFLAQNDYITGAVIPVDGGEHLIGVGIH